eukprot:CAMPEP_0175058996 /NCGR_PEP_ID=MMETSP0052_2-20121109/12177_1 /TAXON_ID=51329 ORGANISM="Polytomella parva, Strain SAG 63-3" /NCGR_SAMPLE_ID=MMETSP0052_2 /ASSEMBLY_ACC=CAM_ASM_000194 /LENGTH=33 /DNA_ID= /DNA_START= /DNA_END= /DNA_ORIENTATION=
MEGGATVEGLGAKGEEKKEEKEKKEEAIAAEDF